MSKELELLVKDLDKMYGAGTLARLGDKPKVQYDRITTGSLLLDEEIGGGYARGRIVELFGWESSGKTSLALSAVPSLQANGELVGFIDVEHAFDRDYAEQLGIDPDELFMSQPDDAEQALEILDRMVATGKFALIIFDSVGGLVPKAELEGEMGKSSMGVVARLMSQAMRKITGKISKTGTVVIFINQLREKIGVMFGNPETTTGGNALKFYASLRIEVRKSGKILGSDGEQIGHTMKMKTVKNKTYPPFRKVETKFYYGIGISYEDEILDTAVAYNIVKKSGSWFSYGDTKLGQGQAGVVSMLRDNPDLVEELVAKINEYIESNNEN